MNLSGEKEREKLDKTLRSAAEVRKHLERRTSHRRGGDRNLENKTRKCASEYHKIKKERKEEELDGNEKKKKRDTRKYLKRRTSHKSRREEW